MSNGSLSGTLGMYQHVRIKIGITIPMNHKRLAWGSDDNNGYYVVATSRLFSSFKGSEATVNIVDIPNEIS